jgi:ribosomal 50S subunit-recycling heat shock protein
LRLDKYLKVSRLIKRRTVAKEIADQGRIRINGNAAKAGSNVAIGDELHIQFGHRLVTVEVTEIKETSKKEEASSMYKVVKEEAVKKEPF